MDFHTRGKRSEEQVRFMQALWAEPHVTFKGEFHQLDDGGINPRPKSGRVPIWFGGHAEATFRRTAKYGDGFMPLAYPAGDEALKAFDKLRAHDPRRRARSRLGGAGSLGVARHRQRRTTGGASSASGRRPA